MTENRSRRMSGEEPQNSRPQDQTRNSGQDPARRRKSRHAPRDNGPTAQWANWILVLAFGALLIWAPLPLGSNREWFVAFLLVAMGALLLIWIVMVTVNFAAPSHYGRVLWPAAALLCVAITIAALQIVDIRIIDAALGTKWARVLAHPVWSLGGEAIGQQLPAFISVNPAKAIPAVLKICLYAATFYLAFELARRRDYANALLWAIIFAGGLNAVAGMAQIATQTHIGAWLTGDQDKADFVRFGGTFPNQNHFATFAAMTLIATLAMTYIALTDGIVTNRGREIAMRTAANTIFGTAFPGLAITLFLAGAIVLSGSRAGTLVMLVGSLAFAGFMATSGKSRQRSNALSNGLLFGILAIGVAVAGAPLLSRINQAGIVDNSRIVIASGTIDAAIAAPWTGNGLGAFIDYYPLYASQTLDTTANAAHNDYLEAWADLGFVGGTALILIPAYLGYLCLLGAARRRRNMHYAAIGASAVLICGLHAMADFSLQIPAVGMTLFALLGIGVAQSWGDDAAHAHDPRMMA